VLNMIKINTGKGSAGHDQNKYRKSLVLDKIKINTGKS
jgi:hypothetical protein